MQITRNNYSQYSNLGIIWVIKKIICFLLLGVVYIMLLVSVTGCSQAASKIDDFSAYSNMLKSADRIEVKFDNYTGSPYFFTIENKDDIEEIMELIFSDLDCVGKEFPVGDNTFMTICQGEQSYSFSDRFISEKGKYYMFSADLHQKIYKAAEKNGAFTYCDE